MKTIAVLYRNVLATRYRVTTTGEDLLNSSTPKLFLPNHQSHADPQILFTILFGKTGFVPIVSARFFKIPVIRTVFKKLNAVPINNIQSSEKIEKDNLNKVVDESIEVLQNGNNVLVYPSGQLAGQGYERIFNKSGAYSIVKGMPENSKVIGVRINGLWGSLSSKAWTGDIPKLGSLFFKGLFFLLSNLLFFMPKRQVTINFVDLTHEAKANARKGKKIFNDGLEQFYNQKKEEVRFLRHHFLAPMLKRELPARIVGSENDLASTHHFKQSDIPKNIQDTVFEVISKETGIESENLQLDTNLTTDLGIDSLILVELVADIEQQFKVAFKGDFAELKTVGDLCVAAMGKTSLDEDLKPTTFDQFSEPRTRVTVDPNLSIRDQFIRTVLKDKKAPLAYDNMIGASSRKDLLLKAIVVSKLIKKRVPEKHVGIMLPALQSTTLLIMATYFADKIPVMLNWTVGTKMLKSCVASAGLSKVITATAFYQKVENQLHNDFKNLCLFFDKEIKTVTLPSKLGAVVQSLLPKLFFPKTSIDETAVILFTSGSETQPKTVPLTHKNIMADLWGVLDILEMRNTDSFIGFLPPFHSFGFSVLSVLTVITGMRVAYTPDPKDSREIVRILRHNKSSVIVATPTFLKIIMSIASDEDFNSIRLAITGAESLHPTIADEFTRKTDGAALLLQGYGITECSPILSVTTSNKQDLKSVGHFISGLEYHVVDLNTYDPLPNGKEGMLVVRGNNVFNGYLDANIESPFIEVGGKEFYKTGDLGYLDKDDNFYITGRLKRFIKVGGEMVSLPAIESAIIEKFGTPGEQLFAVEADESGNKPRIVLFSRKEIAINKVNTYLQEHGFSNLMKLNKVRYVEEIPLLGTGKTDYKLLKQMAQETTYA